MKPNDPCCTDMLPEGHDYVDVCQMADYWLTNIPDALLLTTALLLAPIWTSTSQSATNPACHAWQNTHVYPLWSNKLNHKNMDTSIVFFSVPYISHMHAVYTHALSPPNPQRHTHKITILTLSHITKTTLWFFKHVQLCSLYLLFFVKHTHMSIHHTHINIHHTHVHSPCILSFMVLFSPSSSHWQRP